MAAAWHGGLGGADPSLVKSASLRAAISLAVDFWFANDFANPSCLDSGGTSSCPCGTPGVSFFLSISVPHLTKHAFSCGTRTGSQTSSWFLPWLGKHA
jgi:hypothetical protein